MLTKTVHAGNSVPDGDDRTGDAIDWGDMIRSDASRLLDGGRANDADAAILTLTFFAAVPLPAAAQEPPRTAAPRWIP